MNARDNPFRSECVEAVGYRFVDGGSWEELMARLVELDCRAALVGPDGSGKSTLLDELAGRLADVGFAVKRLFLNDERVLRCGPARTSVQAGRLKEVMAELSGDEIVLFDGADLLGRLAWARFKRRSRRAAGLIVTSHRAGLLPMLVECRTTPELLHDVAAELLGSGGLGLRDRTDALFEEHRGNVRDALRALYDIHAEAL